MVRRVVAAVAAVALTLLLVSPALANDLNQTTPILSTSTAFPPGAGDCVGVQPGQVLWHFVHTGTGSADRPSTLTATFLTAGIVTVSGTQNGNSVVMYNITTGADTLLSASDSIVNTGLLNLSHICDGGPPPVVPEAPASVLLVLTGALAGLGFVGWRMRRSQIAA